MKEGIHPPYRKVVFKDSITQKLYMIGSAISTDKIILIEGIEYPLVLIETSSSSHPFYTGKQRFEQAEGQVAKFKKRHGLV